MSTLEQRQEVSRNYSGPKSFCRCGHLGDCNPNKASGTEHDGPLGHGSCNHAGCNCQKFSWREFTPKFQKTIDQA